MENPFRYGVVVTGDDFADREEEMESINRDILSRQNLFIYSYRRIGKTSLIKNTLSRTALRKKIIPIYVDLLKASNLSEFIKVYADSVSKAMPFNNKVLYFIKSFLSSLSPKIEISQDGSVKISIEPGVSSDSILNSFETVCELPAKFAQKTKKTAVVVFDEFQEIRLYDGTKVEKLLRSHIQHHKNVSYIFMGSKTHIILDMFSNPESAFYKSAKIMHLELIPKDNMIEFIHNKFVKSAKSIDRLTCSEIYDVAGGVPFHVQQLCSYIWNLSARKIDLSIIDRAIDEIIKEHNDDYFILYDELTSNQKSVLKAVLDKNDMYSRDTLIKYNLPGPSGIASAINALFKRGILKKEKNAYLPYDVFFSYWVKKMASN